MGGAATDADERDRVPLDRVMLAMDVVDTLRHQRDLVERELDDEARSRAFTAQVQRIYDAQGIDVDEQVIAEAVRALKEDRFVYTAPARTFAVRLATVYVERGKWALRLLVVGGLALALYAAFAIPAHYHRRGLVDSFAQRIATTLRDAEAMVRSASVVERSLVPQDVDRAAWREALDAAQERVVTGRTTAQRVVGVLQPGPDPESYPDDRRHWDAVVTAHSEALASADGELEAAREVAADVVRLRAVQRGLVDATRRIGAADVTDAERMELTRLLDAVDQRLAGTDGAAASAALLAVDEAFGAAMRARQQEAESRAELERLRRALPGVDVEAAAARERGELEQTAAEALDAGDLPRARGAIERLRALVRELDLVYELRIVQNGQAGVWRYPTADRRVRNHYIIVEAVGPDGKVLRLPIASEEDGGTRVVRQFGIGVPEAVYERVKADKLDNRIVDDRVFGHKRRGRRQPDYRFEVEGGRITSW